MSSFPVVLNVYDMVRKNHFLLLSRPPLVMFIMERGRGSCCKLQASFKIFTQFSVFII